MKTNNELREEISKCLFASKIFKFMAFNIDRGSKEPEKQKEFLEKLVIIMPDRYQNKCEKKKTMSEDYDDGKTMPEETDDEKTMPEESDDERINFFLDIVKYFRCECIFAKQIDSKLESVKRFFVNLKVCYYKPKTFKNRNFHFVNETTYL
ncbi:unnamed protein product [Meloidogyne enterolobii]|uniref:Uncharacterized protein n=1 Tax=Meloidogyne enterolobii TaxID=390850 RepID=A0ACB1B842_MELEN